MPIVVSESYLSRRFTLGDQAGRELVYDIWGDGADDEAAVQAQLALVVPPTYQGLEIETLSVEPEQVDENTGQALWRGVARYVRFESDDEYTFSTGGGTSKVTQALATIATYSAPGLVAPDFQGAIGVNDDRVEGVDVTIPNFQFTETHRFPDASVDATYKRNLFLLTGAMNNATFKGLNAGEALFLGADGTKRGDEKWSITFRFAGAPNVTGLSVGTITGIAKFGWDYLWVRYEEFADSFAFRLVKRPVAAYVVRVIQPGNFGDLNIGT